ncbi:MAG: hypothetical protein J6J00_07265 [Treponema sp.]|jgi:hypothetical protein|nr:hypothetical protein [Treponema sp.]
MNIPLSKVLEESNEFVRRIAGEQKYGDIIVKITLNDGFPVKLEKAFSEHLTKRKTTRLVVQK